MNDEKGQRCAVCHEPIDTDLEDAYLVLICTPDAAGQMMQTGRFHFRQYWASACERCRPFLTSDTEL